MTVNASSEEVAALQQQVAQLQARIVDLEQQNSDLEIALQTAIEHGDAIDREISMTNRRLVGEIAERVRAEARLERLLDALRQQKTDLEIVVSMVSEHSDGIDHEWLRLYREIETHAMTDELTGIANRRGLNVALNRSWRHCLRTGEPLALLILDIDWFKPYNDTLGHQAGDRCLSQVGALLRRACRRPDDVASRYGGEEFVVLLPQTDLAGAVHVIEVIRAELATQAIEHPASSYGVVTVSIGGAVSVPKAESDVAALLALADQRLFAAKHAGRNTFRID